MRKISLILKKELLEIVRDRQTFVLIVVTPLVFYPLMIGAIGYFTQMEKIREEKAIYKLGIIHPAFDLSLVTHIKETGRFEVITGNDVTLMFDKEKVKAVLKIMDPGQEKEIVIYYDGADKESQSAMERITEIVSEYSDSLVQKRISEYGLSPKILEPFIIEKQNIAGAERMGGFKLGMLIPYFLILMSFGGAIHLASNITAGEKERRTMETLLVTNVKRGEIVIGKMLSVFSISLLTTISGVVGLIATFYAGFTVLAGGEEIVSVAIPWFSCLLMLVVMLPLIGFFSSLLVAVGSASRNMNEAGNYISYIFFVIIILAIFSVMRLTAPAVSLFFVPVLNTALLQQQILVGEFRGLSLIITLSSTIIYASIVFFIAKVSFEKEKILFRS